MDDDTRMKLKVVLDVETPVYYNSRIPLKGLVNPGPLYSLCGRLQQIRKSLYQVCNNTIILCNALPNYNVHV